MRAMSSNLEIEERALVDKTHYDAILKHMRTLGEVRSSRRVMINFTAMEYARGESVELRLNDGALSKVVKKGAFGGTATEETTQLDIPLQKALEQMAQEGYTTAKVSLRIRHVVKAGGYEYCIRDIARYDDPNIFAFPALFEIEAETADAQSEDSIRTHIRKLMTELGATVATIAEFQSWSEYNHTQVDGDFVYSEQSADDLIRTLQTVGFLS